MCVSVWIDILLSAVRDAGGSRDDFDRDLAEMIEGYAPDMIVLAGWMHILSEAFVSRFDGRIINLHPALPGAFDGANAIGEQRNGGAERLC